MRKYPVEYSVTGPLSKLYRCWYDMRRRCSSRARPNDAHYYAKGRKVCEEWNYWPAFASWAISAGWEEGLQIDRIDNDGDYSPDNCRFVTAVEQNRNRDLSAIRSAIKATHTRRFSKPFICVETQKIYETEIEASRDTGIERRTIGRALKGVYSQAGGFHWRYMEVS